ncbi:hypothetical protein Hdeb2414_s0009g00302261 [Helianthus debilis subsp. tardiflorus]
MNEYRAIKQEMEGTNTLPVPKLRHELSLCRVYVVSGTTRAFDRRPFGIGTTTEKVNPDASRGASSSSSQTILQSSNSSCPQSSCPYIP